MKGNVHILQLHVANRFFKRNKSSQKQARLPCGKLVFLTRVLSQLEGLLPEIL